MFSQSFALSNRVNSRLIEFHCSKVQINCSNSLMFARRKMKKQTTSLCESEQAKLMFVRKRQQEQTSLFHACIVSKRMSNEIDEENNEKNSSSERQVNGSICLIYSRNQISNSPYWNGIDSFMFNYSRRYNWHDFFLFFMALSHVMRVSIANNIHFNLVLTSKCCCFFSSRKSFHWMNSHITVRCMMMILLLTLVKILRQWNFCFLWKIFNVWNIYVERRWIDQINLSSWRKYVSDPNMITQLDAR